MSPSAVQRLIDVMVMEFDLEPCDTDEKSKMRFWIY